MLIKIYRERMMDVLLDTEELRLVQSKNRENQLGFAVMLKFFQKEGRYPMVDDLLSPDMVNCLVEQLGLGGGSGLKKFFKKKNQNSKRFRKDIRKLFGYSQASIEDGEKLVCWLIEKILPESPTLQQGIEHAHLYLRDNKLEPFSSRELQRYVHSAMERFEKQHFSDIVSKLPPSTIDLIDSLLNDDVDDTDDFDEIDGGVSAKQLKSLDVKFRHLKKGVSGNKLKHVAFEIAKLEYIRQFKLPPEIFDAASRKLVKKYDERIMGSSPSNILELIPESRYACMASFCYFRSQILTDNLADFFLIQINKLRVYAESYVNKNIVNEVKHVNGKFDILYKLAETACECPEGIIKNEIYEKVSRETLRDVVNDLKHKGGKWYQTQVNTKIHSLYSHAHRKVLLELLKSFTFQSSTPQGEQLVKAINFVIKNIDAPGTHYSETESVPITDVIATQWKTMVMEPYAVSPEHSAENNSALGYRVNKFNYEVAVLGALHSQLMYKSVWIEGAYRYRDPTADLPGDWEINREYYYKLMGLPLDPEEFVQGLKGELHLNLQLLNDNIASNKKVKIIDTKKGGRFKITPYDAQDEPANIKELQREINKRWATLNLIDILKETDLRIGFTKQFHSNASREILDKDQLHKRLLLSLFGIGSNTGLKRISSANDDVNYNDLTYVKRRFINESNVRMAIVDIINGIISIRDPKIWGEATVGCACDSTLIRCYDQNLMTQFLPRKKEAGVMIYYHVDGNSAVIYSQLKTCLSSEVGAMINGVLKHDSQMNMDKTYVDTHGQSVVGFGISYGLKFDLLPRIKGINKCKLYYPSSKDQDSYPNLSNVMKSHINFNHIKKYYDDYVKHLVAIKIGLVEPDILIKKFSNDNYTHPAYKTFTEIGNANKTIFLCRYLVSEELRIEINSALNIVERLNGIMGFIFYGKLGEISTNRKEEQILAMVCLHLLQVSMVYINTLIIQEVLSDPKWIDKLTPEDLRALSPLIHSHINPYGLFPLDITKRIIIEPKKQQESHDRTYARAA